MKNKKKLLEVFIVNLKKDIQKKEYMNKLCLKNNMKFEFIEAIYGKTLEANIISEVYSKSKAIARLGRELSKGEIGCALSHKGIFEKIINENIEVALVLEDDISFNHDLLALLDVPDSFEKDWEVVLLGHHTGYSRDVDTRESVWYNKQLNSKYKLVRPCEKGYGTYGYLITNKGAKKLLNHLNIIEKPIDHYTGNSKHINVYTINPAPIKIYEELSEQHNSMKDRKVIQDNQKNLLSSIVLQNEVLNSFKNKIKGMILSIVPLKRYK